MACPCCSETVPCSNGTNRRVPSSVTVVVNVGSVIFDRTGVAGCAAWFPPVVNGTYVLARVPGTLTYKIVVGNFVLKFTFNASATYSLLQLDFCQDVNPCGVAMSWLLDVTTPTVCDWPSGGTGTVTYNYNSSRSINLASYFSCFRFGSAVTQVFYAGSISVTPA